MHAVLLQQLEQLRLQLMCHQRQVLVLPLALELMP